MASSSQPGTERAGERRRGGRRLALAMAGSAALTVAVSVAAIGGASVAGVGADSPARLPGIQGSRCADCHLARQDVPARRHVQEWEVSPHGRNEVGCEACHGGDPSTSDLEAAHRTVLSARNPASPIHRSNLPHSCGLCHVGPYVAFQRSVHFELRQQGDERMPVCSECHGSVGAHRPSPRGLEARCADCHAEDGDETARARPGLPATAREVLAEIAALRELLDQARPLVERTAGDRRRALQFAHEQAEAPMSEAVEEVHALRFEAASERLPTARHRIEQLLDELVSPSVEPREPG